MAFQRPNLCPAFQIPQPHHRVCRAVNLRVGHIIAGVARAGQQGVRQHLIGIDRLHDRIRPGAPDQGVTAGAAGEAIVPVAAVECIRAAARQEESGQGVARMARSAFQALGITDGYILAAYADFLLDQGRPLEAAALLKDWERSDILLLRLALAEQAAGLKSAAAHAAMLKARFDASALRGDKLHQQDEARFHLDMLGDAKGALRLAAENYRVQREPGDARMLMEAALAAKDYAAAQPALDWLRRSGYEDPIYAKLARQLQAAAK